ncbi:MAG: hypothetical protein HYY06_16300 [Deltaproteobacteria bacterium]|nr:hypothetical protein [Deltaproteobacteria bacterium]
MEAIALAVTVTHREKDERAEEAARSAPDAAALGRLVFEVLVRQAEGKVSASPAGWVASRAREQGISKEQADTKFGNILAILERGAETAGEIDVVGAFFARGLTAFLEAENQSARAQAFRRILSSLDWLVAYTPYDVYAHVQKLCPEAIARVVWEGLTAAIEEEARAGGAQGRIHRLLRAEVLLSHPLAPVAGEIRARLVRVADPAVVALARATGQEASIPMNDAGAEADRVTGRVGPRPVGRIRRILSLCTGYALLRTIASAAGRYLLGFRRSMEISLAPKGLLCRKRIELLGKTIRESEEVVPFAGLASVERESRYPYLYLLVGVGGLALGAIWGVLRIFDGIRGAYAPLALIGLVAIALGVGFDLGLATFWPARRGRVSLTFLRAPKRWTRLVDVDAEAARRFVAAMHERLGRGPGSPA